MVLLFERGVQCGPVPGGILGWRRKKEGSVWKTVRGDVLQKGFRLDEFILGAGGRLVPANTDSAVVFLFWSVVMGD